MANAGSRRRQTGVDVKSHRIDHHATHETLALCVLGDLSVMATFETGEHLSGCPKCEAKLPRVRAVLAAHSGA